MINFVFAADLHLKVSSNVREGDFLEDIASKLQFTVDYCNKHDAILLIGGDVFHTPSVPDMVKNRIIPILKGLKTACYALTGNHDVLYNNRDYSYKTSLQTLVSTGVVKSLDFETIDFGECIVTSVIPVKTLGKPQILVYHGFLNVDDGEWTLHYEDVTKCKDKLYVCLGHDHVPYEPLQVTENIKILRPGSFSRITREAESFRIPNLLHIKVQDGNLYNKLVPISIAKTPEQIFKVKESTISEKDKRTSYESIIAQIRDAGASNMSFDEALKSVTTEDVCKYIKTLVTENRVLNQSKSKNL